MLSRSIPRRALTRIVGLLGLTVPVFFPIRLRPADPVSRLVGMNASAEAYAQAEAQLGLNRPVPEPLAIDRGLRPEVAPGLMPGALGTFSVTRSAVGAEIRAYLPVTPELITLGVLAACAVAVPVGMLSALRPGGRRRRACSSRRCVQVRSANSGGGCCSPLSSSSSSSAGRRRRSGGCRR